MVKLIIFHSWLCEIGGCETVIANMCEQLKDWYDITVVHTGGDYRQIQRLENMVDTERYNPNKEYKCDVMIRNSSWGIEPNNIVSSQNKYIQMIHSDYIVHKQKGTFTYKKWDKITYHVGCGEHVAKMFTKVTGYECIPINNILSITKPINKIYKYIYAGRLNDTDKVANVERIRKFFKLHDKAGIKWNLYIYTNTEVPEDFKENENYIIRKARYYDLHDEMADVDYGILFSDAEGRPCFLDECQQYGTPCIATNNGGNMDVIKDGVNGYVVPMDMNFDINKIKKIPVIKNYTNGTTAKTWCDLLGGAKYKIKKRTPKKIVEENPDFFDTKVKVLVLKRIKGDNGTFIEPDTIVRDFSEFRASILEKEGFVIRKEDENDNCTTSV